MLPVPSVITSGEVERLRAIGRPVSLVIERSRIPDNLSKISKRNPSTPRDLPRA
jgi:hypothetical protein